VFPPPPPCELPDWPSPSRPCGGVYLIDRRARNIYPESKRFDSEALNGGIELYLKKRSVDRLDVFPPPPPGELPDWPSPSRPCGGVYLIDRRAVQGLKFIVEIEFS
jgi:hypothetical protein